MQFRELCPGMDIAPPWYLIGSKIAMFQYSISHNGDRGIVEMQHGSRVKLDKVGLIEKLWAGKKGIALPADQWQRLCGNANQISAIVGTRASKGRLLPSVVDNAPYFVILRSDQGSNHAWGVKPPFCTSTFTISEIAAPLSKWIGDTTAQHA